MPDKKNAPEIRFKGFLEPWIMCNLDNILTQRIEHQKITKAEPLLAFSYSEGVINPEDKKTNKRDFIMVDKYNKIFSRTEKGDIIYNPANIIHGAIHRNNLKTGVVSPIYKIFKCNNVSSKFIGECLHRDKFIEEIIKYIEGTVIKLRTLSPEQFLKMNIILSTYYTEQERIGEFFSEIDDLIKFQQQKIDNLQNVKKSMLDKMFPKNGNTIPEIRFKGFNDTWEKLKLGNVVDVYDGTHQTPFYQSNGIMFLSVENITTLQSEKYISLEDFQTNYKIFPQKNDILMTRIGDIGTANVVENNIPKAFYVSLALLKYKNTNPYFLKNAIESNFVKKELFERSLTTAIPMKINKDEIGKVKIIKPCAEEQQKIGKFFSKIDDLIKCQQQKLEKLKNIKKSMLDKMFV